MNESDKTARKPANLALPVDRSADAKHLGINISHSCEIAARQGVNPAKVNRWAAENAEFIAEYNKRIEAEATLLQEWTPF